MGAAVGTIETHRDEPALRVHVDAVALRAEVGVSGSPSGHDQVGVPAFGGHPDEVEAGTRSEVPGPHEVLQSRSPKGHDPRAVPRPDRVPVVGRKAGEPLRLLLPVRADLPDVPPLVGPGDVGQPLAVGRPGGLELPGLRRSEATGSSQGNVHHVEVGQRREGEAPAVGRLHRRLHQAGPHRTLLHAGGEVQRGTQVLRDLRGEGHVASVACGQADAVDLPAVRDDHFLAVGRECVAGKEVAGIARLLVVVLDGVLEPALFAAGEITDA